MQGEFHNHPEFISHPEFIAHLEIDYLEEQAVLPEQVSFSEFFPLDEMENHQECPPQERRKPLWLFWRTLAKIIVVLCSLILFAVMLLRYPAHVTFQLQAVQSDSATLNLHLTVLQELSSDISYQVTDYNEGLHVTLSSLREGDNSIFLQNLKPDTVYQINILRDGERIRGFFFNTLPAQGLPPEALPPEPQNTAQTIVEPVQEEGKEVPDEEAPAEEPAADNVPEENPPPVTPPVIIIIPPANPPANPAATGPVNPLAIEGVFGGDASDWSIIVNLFDTDTGGEWMPTDQDEGTVMIDWQLRDDLGNTVASGTTSYEDMIQQFGIPLPGSISSGNYSVDVQVNFVNTDNITTLLDNLDGGYVREDFIQSQPANLPTNVTITQTDNASALELIYNYLWEKAASDEGNMNGGYWMVIDAVTNLTIDSGSIDNSLLGHEIPVTLPDDVTTVGVYFSPLYENQGGLYSIDSTTAYQEITLPDTGQTFMLFLLQPDSGEISEEAAPSAEETTSEEAASTEETVPEETSAPVEETVPEEDDTPVQETIDPNNTVTH